MKYASHETSCESQQTCARPMPHAIIIVSLSPGRLSYIIDCETGGYEIGTLDLLLLFEHVLGQPLHPFLCLLAAPLVTTFYPRVTPLLPRQFLLHITLMIKQKRF